jgi:hypothetical protein
MIGDLEGEFDGVTLPVDIVMNVKGCDKGVRKCATLEY